MDLLQATLQPLQFRRPVALHPANSLRHSEFASHDFFALRRRRSRALQIETQLGVLGPGRFDEARITLGDGEGISASQSSPALGIVVKPLVFRGVAVQKGAVVAKDQRRRFGLLSRHSATPGHPG